MATKKKTSSSKPAAKKAAKQSPATRAAEPPRAAKASPSKVAKPIPELKPGWTSRVFGIETGRLVACDAKWDGDNWERGDKFEFLYRSRRGKWFVLTDAQNWAILTEDKAHALYKKLPEKLHPEQKAFEPIVIEPVPQSRD